MTAAIGEGHDRLDGRAKVTGGARYSAEVYAPGAAHAALVLSTIASGRVRRIDASRAQRTPGFVGILTHENAAFVPPGEYRTWLKDAIVHHAGQPLALVLADSARAARAAAARVSVTYRAGPALPRLFDANARAYVAPSVLDEQAVSLRGDLSEGRAAAAAVVEAIYTTPTNCHSPLEPHAVVARWEGGRVTIHTSTSGIFAARRTVARAMRIAEDDVRVLMLFQGGGFGAKGSAWWPSLILAASAARTFRRPVRLELTREQMFTVVGRRSPTLQKVTVGASREGRLTLLAHEAVQETSPLAEYSDPTCFASRSVYSCENVATCHKLVRTNAPQPNAMRAPGEGPGSFALESALDELAHELRLDPVELRLRNIASRDEHRGREWSSNGLRACLVEGARAFGWASRAPGPVRPRARGLSTGQGMASAYYPVFQAPAAARVRIDDRGVVTLGCGNQDVGTGSLTIMAQSVARELGVRADEVVVEYGDTRLPETPMAAGSMGTASVIPAIERAARALRDKILLAASTEPGSPLYGRPVEGLYWASPSEIIARDGSATVTAVDLARRLAVAGWVAEEKASPPETPVDSGSAFGACFAEVQVDRELGLVRVTRLTGVYAAGRILNATTARSQCVGGMIFGVGMALCERVEDDAKAGRPVNGNLSGYLVPTQADVPAIDVRFVEECDKNPASHGIKGVGMIGTVGVAAAIANAVFDATGLRIRHLPVSPDKLLLM